MVYTYKESIELLGSHQNLIKALKEKRFFKIDDGLYSNEKNPREIAIFVKKHKDAVFTMESALYYLGISDVISEYYVVATSKDATKYKDGNVKQYFLNNKPYDLGKIYINRNGVEIPIFNKERMLIEVVRYKNKLPFDYYKECISYFRNHIDEINIPLVLDYVESFPKSDLIKKTIQMEVL